MKLLAQTAIALLVPAYVLMFFPSRIAFIAAVLLVVVGAVLTGIGYLRHIVEQVNTDPPVFLALAGVLTAVGLGLAFLMPFSGYI